MNEGNKSNTGNQDARSKKELFLERFGKRFPGIRPDDDDAFYGALGGEFDRMDRSDAAQKELGELLANDPRSAGFLMVMRRGGNPMEYLIEQYGDDFRAALEDEEKAKRFSAAFAKYAEKQANEKALQEQAGKNLQKMLDDLEAARKEGRFTDGDADQAFAYLYGDGGLLERTITNDVRADDWMALMKAARYDAMQSDAEARVAEARHEGEVSGRNANIDIRRRKQGKSGRMPADLPASGGAPRDGGKDPLLANLDKIVGRKKSVWDD